MRVLKCLFLLFFVTINVAAAYAQDASFLTLSDMHLNTELLHRMQIDPGGYDKKNDLDKRTFQSLIALIKKNLGTNRLPKKPDFVLYLGDAVGHTDLMHGSRHPYVIHSEAVIDHALLNLFPNTPIVVVMGNNDSYERDYGRYLYDDRSPFMVAESVGFKNGFLSTGVMCVKSKPDEKQSKMPCLVAENTQYGFFSIKIKPKLVLLGVNSVMFSVKHDAKASAVKAQMQFIEKTLQAAQKEHAGVLIAMHIPVGNNTYNGHAFWKPADTKKFMKLLNEYQNTVRGILVGHTHMDEIKVLHLKDGLLGEYYTAALSTSHGNSPSLKRYDLLHHNGQWYLDNYEAYQIHWHERKLSLTPFYQYVKKYCNHYPVYNINSCLKSISFQQLWPQYTVGNPNYPLAKLHAKNAFSFEGAVE